MRMLIELLPFIAPKLSAVGVGSLNDMDFASRLDRAVERSRRAQVQGPKVLEDLRFKPIQLDR
jgi:hypothetical protein